MAFNSFYGGHSCMVRKVHNSQDADIKCSKKEETRLARISFFSLQNDYEFHSHENFMMNLQTKKLLNNYAIMTRW